MAFTADDPDVELFGYDLAFPLAFDGSRDLAIVSGEDNVISALPIRAMTARGEIEIFPDDGLDLDDLQNGLGTDGERAALQARVLEQYKRDDRLADLSAPVEDGPDGPSDTLVHLQATLRNGKTATASVTFGGGL